MRISQDVTLLGQYVNGRQAEHPWMPWITDGGGSCSGQRRDRLSPRPTRAPAPSPGLGRERPATPDRARYRMPLHYAWRRLRAQPRFRRSRRRHRPSALGFLREVDAINLLQRTRTPALAWELAGGDLASVPVCVLGAAFKPGSNDV